MHTWCEVFPVPRLLETDGLASLWSCTVTLVGCTLWHVLLLCTLRAFRQVLPQCPTDILLADRVNVCSGTTSWSNFWQTYADSESIPSFTGTPHYLLTCGSIVLSERLIVVQLFKTFFGLHHTQQSVAIVMNTTVGFRSQPENVVHTHRCCFFTLITLTPGLYQWDRVFSVSSFNSALFHHPCWLYRLEIVNLLIIQVCPAVFFFASLYWPNQMVFYGMCSRKWQGL